MGIKRTTIFRISAWFGLTALSLAPFGLVLAIEGANPVIHSFAIAWLIAALAVGSTFLKPLGILALAGFGSAAILTQGLLLPGQQSGWVVSSLVLYLLCSTLILVSVYRRKQLEVFKVNELQEKNLELEALRNALTENTQSGAGDLERRINQLRTTAEISEAVSSAIDLNPILPQVIDSIREGFGLYYVGLFLLDESQSFAVLKTGTGEAGMRMVAEGHRLAVGGASMVGWAISHKKPRIALDVGHEAIHFNNPYLPETRSEMALPLIGADGPLGALSIQSSEPLAFDDEDLAVVEGIASTLAAAVYKSSRFKQLQDNLSEIQALHTGYLTHSWSGRRASDSGYEYRREGAFDGDPGEVSTIAIPLTLREQVIGELTVETAKTDWSPEEQAFIEAITNQAAVAMENARLLDETRRRVEQERIVTDIVGKLYGTADINQILRTGLQELSLALDAAEGTIVFGEDRKSLPG